MIRLPELGDDSFDLAPVGGNVPEASPVVGLDREVSQGQEPKNCSSPIADKDIQDPMVPPAFRKVWQLVFQRVLKELEHDGDDRREPPVAKDESLAEVAERMRENEDVKLLLDVVVRIFGLLPVIHATVAAVILFRNRLTQILIEVLQKLPEKRTGFPVIKDFSRGCNS